MTIDEAIDISWGADRYRGAPRPDPAEALDRIQHQLAVCGFNWLTGQEAREVLQRAVSMSSEADVCKAKEIMRTAKEIKQEIRQLKKEMKERGIRITSFTNRQPSLEAARANERLFALKAELEKATRH